MAHTTRYRYDDQKPGLTDHDADRGHLLPIEMFVLYHKLKPIGRCPLPANDLEAVSESSAEAEKARAGGFRNVNRR